MRDVRCLVACALFLVGGALACSSDDEHGAASGAPSIPDASTDARAASAGGVAGASTGGVVGAGGRPESGGAPGAGGDVDATIASGGSGGVTGAGGGIDGSIDGGGATGGTTGAGGSDAGSLASGGTDAGTGGSSSTGGAPACAMGVEPTLTAMATGPSCAGGLTCGTTSCCQNSLVPGGTFQMGRGVTGCDGYPTCVPPTTSDCGGANEMPEHPVTVSAFYLDLFEVTTARFRKFVEAYTGPPQTGAGAHPLIAGSGWQSTWNASLPANRADFETARGSCYGLTPGAYENVPTNCANWYEAFAFCIWDGGRLPTEAEWEFAAAGGDQDRLYPWGSAPPTTELVNCCNFPGAASLVPVGSRPLGAGRWGQEDLAGGRWEWVFDGYDGNWYSGGGATCNDCANVADGALRSVRGGSYFVLSDQQRAAERSAVAPANHGSTYGFRCAR